MKTLRHLLDSITRPARYIGGELTLDAYLDAMTQMARLVHLESK